MTLEGSHRAPIFAEMPRKKQAKPWENGGKAGGGVKKKKAISIPRRPSVIDGHGKDQFNKEIHSLNF